MLIDSKTNNVSIDPVNSLPHTRLRRAARAAVTSSGSQIARSWMYTGLVNSPVPSNTSRGCSLKTAGRMPASHAAAFRTATTRA